MDDSFNLVSLMVSKLCHDLIGSAGSLAFALDIIVTDNDNLNHDALSLVKQSSAALVSRIKYFRAAIGYADISYSDSIATKIKELVEDLYLEKHIRISWPEKYSELVNNVLTNYNTKMLLSILLLSFFISPKNSTIQVLMADVANQELGIMVMIRGAKVVLDQESIDIIVNNNTDITISAHNVLLYFINFLKNQAGSTIEIKNLNNGVDIAFTLPKSV